MSCTNKYPVPAAWFQTDSSQTNLGSNRWAVAVVAVVEAPRLKQMRLAVVAVAVAPRLKLMRLAVVAVVAVVEAQSVQYPTSEVAVVEAPRRRLAAAMMAVVAVDSWQPGIEKHQSIVISHRFLPSLNPSSMCNNPTVLYLPT